MKATDFIIKNFYLNCGITTIFTYAGGTNAFLIDAVYRLNSMRMVVMRHEQNVAFAAEGFARASERMGLALTMSGPGATNLVTGIANAYFDSIPTFYLTGQVVSSSYKFDKPIRQLGYQETDIVSIVKPITKYAAVVPSVAMISDMMNRAVTECISERPGSVLLDIPMDFQKGEIDASKLKIKSLQRKTKAPKNTEIDAVLAAILKSKRPIILAGGGIRSSKSTRLLYKFAHTFHIPVVVSLMGKDTFPNDDPLYVGFIGTYGNRYANLALANCDLLLALGTRLDSRQTAVASTFARTATKIHVEIDASEINNTLVADLNIKADVKDFFQMIFKRNHTRQPSKGIYAEWMTHIDNMKHDIALSDEINTDVNPKYFLKIFSEEFRDDEIFTTDLGNNQMWCAQTLLIKKNQRFLTSGGLGSMGFSLPAAIGAHYACPKRSVIALCGDGGFQMSTAELQTIKNYNIPIKIIVFNNSVLGLMRVFQDENFEGRHPATEIGYSCPTIKKIARAYGIRYVSITRNRAIKNEIRKLKKIRGPIIVEVKISKNLNAYPKVRGKAIEHQIPELTPKQIKKYMLIPSI